MRQMRQTKMKITIENDYYLKLKTDETILKTLCDMNKSIDNRVIKIRETLVAFNNLKNKFKL